MLAAILIDPPDRGNRILPPRPSPVAGAALDKTLNSPLHAVPAVSGIPLPLRLVIRFRFKALIDPSPDPQVVHSAIEEIRQLAGQNVIEILGGKIDALGSRIDTLQKVIWPLIGLVATTVFGLLYIVVTGS